MPFSNVTPAAFNALFDQIMQVDLFGTAPPDLPFQDASDASAVSTAIDSGTRFVPLAFQNVYVNPLVQNLGSVLAQLDGDATTLETISGAVYQHGNASIRPPLHRFLAVISDLFRSFLSAQKRAQADFPLVEQLPPMAMFQHNGQNGPFTLPVDAVRQLFGGSSGVVSMPATYKEHPFLWAALSHETGGHDVTHADAGLLPELRAGVRSFFGGPLGGNSNPSTGQLLGLLWDYWMDEASADVYGVLNIGPNFGLNLVAFFAALNAQALQQGKPILRTESGADNSGNLDVHPTDILRPYLILGVIGGLQRLSQEAKDGYSKDLETLAQLCAPSTKSVQFNGVVTSSSGEQMRLNQTLPFDDLQHSARRVGAFIATTQLNSLGKHSIQDIETWDDADEAVAASISEALQNKKDVSALGDDAQLLAGATMALFAQPSSYSQVQQLLNTGLDASFKADPIWGAATPDLMYMRYASLQKPRKSRSKSRKANGLKS
jgi:hypothetical protein